MRTVSAALAQDMAAEVTHLCRLFRITRADGTVLRFTDHDNHVIVAGDGTYRADIGFDCSAVALSASQTAQQSATITLQLSDDGFKEYDVRARMFQAATAEIMVVNYLAPSHGILKLFKGTFGRIALVEQSFATVELGPHILNTNPTIGFEAFSMTCRVSLGSGPCGINIEALKETLTVASVSGLDLTVTGLAAHSDGYWGLGYVRWLTGNNTGLVVPVRFSSGGVISLSYRVLRTILPTDTASIYPGCDKIITTCRDKFNIVINFRGEPWVPNMQDINFSRTTVAIRPGISLGV